MLDNYLSLTFDVEGKTFKGFCMRINDEFYETYAVILDGYESFSIWLDQSKSQWKASKYANIDSNLLNSIITSLPRALRVSK